MSTDAILIPSHPYLLRCRDHLSIRRPRAYFPQRYNPTLSSRLFSTSARLPSGHNRWSKIKNDKGKVDATRGKTNSHLAKEIQGSSKSAGPDPTTNARLATLLLEAKRSGFPKPRIQAAINRGQGISASGAPLQSMTVEFMLPAHGVAAIVECETDNRMRTMQRIQAILKPLGGVTTPTAYMFERRGRVLFDNGDGHDGSGAGHGVTSEDEVLEQAIEAGALDVEHEESGGERVFAVSTEPAEMASVADALSGAFGRQPRSRELVWAAKEDARLEVPPGNEELAAMLENMVVRLEDEDTVRDFYLNTV